jgi:uncharacterized membrane protein
MKQSRKNQTKKLIFAALMTALICASTALIKLPLPLGYVHLGDAFVVAAAFLLSPWYGFLAAAIGSCMADLFLGYAAYAPVTFLLKGGMVLAVIGVLKLWKSGKRPIVGQILAGLAAVLLMVMGYYVFEGFLYGFGAALVSVPFNAVQGSVGVILGLLLVQVLKSDRWKEFRDLFDKK